MKKFRFLAMAAAAVMMLGACSDDQIKGVSDNPLNPEAQEGVYFALQIDLPSKGGSRSATNTGDDDQYGTSTGGVEIGKDYENNIGEAIVVLARSTSNATTNNAFIAAATVPSNQLNGISADQTSYKVLSKFSKTQLSTFYSSLRNPTPNDFLCNIYVFANPTSDISAIIFGDKNDDTLNGAQINSNSWINDIVTLEVNPRTIAQKDAFLMSNGVRAVRAIPQTLEDWRFYSTEGNPFDLSGENAEVYIDNSEINERGSIKLERSSARFDFRDGSPLAETQPFTYHVVYSGSNESDAADRQPIIDIELINMSLVNANTKFYPLRRVSDNGTNTNALICGVEKAWVPTTDGGYKDGNFVVDANYTWKNTAATQLKAGNQNQNYSANFFYPFFSNTGEITASQREGWYTTLCKTIINNGEGDNWENWTGRPEPNPEYKIWTYATENTIAEVDDQINGISTGIVFKGKMLATEWALSADADAATRELAQAINDVNTGKTSIANSKVIYMFNGNLYLGWTNVRNAAIAAAIPSIHWEGDAATGKWVFNIDDINRTNSLYVAVFGGGGIGTVSFTYTEYDEETGEPILGEDGKPIKHTGEITDTKPVDVLSSNYLYQAWSDYTGSATEKRNKEVAYKKAMTDAKIFIYQAYGDTAAYGGPGYYVYYYYWNRHNDNGNNGVMGPMEFAVVRNNVYKLAVTDIKKLGHPRISENDPERPTGDTDDEVDDVYITVTAEVLPWVVRVNNIEF